MSMIKCPECGRNISSMAKACPECGFPLQEHIEEIEKQMKKAEEAKSSSTQSAPVEHNRPEPRVINKESQQQFSYLPTPKPPKTHKLMIWIMVLVVLAILVGGYWLFSNRQDGQREDRAYELLQDCQDPLQYEDFIARYPESSHIDVVRKRYEALVKEQAEWKAIVLRGSRNDVKNFIATNPNSPLIRTARARLDTLDWKEAKRVGSMVSYNTYLDNHPDGSFVDDADIQVERIKRENEERAKAAQARQDSLNSLLADSLVGPAATTPSAVLP